MPCRVIILAPLVPSRPVGQRRGAGEEWGSDPVGWMPHPAGPRISPVTLEAVTTPCRRGVASSGEKSASPGIKCPVSPWAEAAPLPPPQMLQPFRASSPSAVAQQEPWAEGRPKTSSRLSPSKNPRSRVRPYSARGLGVPLMPPPLPLPLRESRARTPAAESETLPKTKRPPMWYSTVSNF